MIIINKRNEEFTTGVIKRDVYKGELYGKEAFVSEHTGNFIEFVNNNDIEAFYTERDLQEIIKEEVNKYDQKFERVEVDQLLVKAIDELKSKGFSKWEIVNCEREEDATDWMAVVQDYKRNNQNAEDDLILVVAGFYYITT
ncbi:hypothetical protein ACFSGI_08790 [Paenibacillus nicotianae]|uniref:Phage protein n=1 Tax=Paenibacillus nicotianae TaxID=1526551 RepID=A0ABW4USV3_9BACL